MLKVDAQGRQKRRLRDVHDVPHSPAASLWRTARNNVALAEFKSPAGISDQRKLRNRTMFLTKSFLEWVKQYVSQLFSGKDKFRTYPAGQKGLFTIPEQCTIALAADWGTATESAYRVGDLIASRSPEITIHMGDVYYSGKEQEYQDYFVAANCWPRGTLQTYVLNANHEMYGGGRGYFRVALPQYQQAASYFCLENSNWRIVAIDTGYHVDRGFALIFSNKTKLDDANVRWLKDIVFANPEDKRPVILLSHHNWFSSFDRRAYPKVGEQLQPWLDRVAIWFWGHEHRLAGYDLFAPDSKQKRVRARCIGHGGMPIELGRKIEHPETPLLFHDGRQGVDGEGNPLVVDGTRLGICGFAQLRLQGNQLIVKYIDENGTELVEENWTASEGTITGSVHALIDHPDFFVREDIKPPLIPHG